MSIYNTHELIEEPLVDLGEIVDLVNSITGLHSLADHENTVVGRLIEGSIDVVNLDILVSDESVCTLTDPRNYVPET